MEQEKEQQKQKQSKQQQPQTSNTGVGTGLSPSDEADDDGQEFGDYVATDGESLLSLVEPEMKMLSQYWLSALKDYALLSLPPGTVVALPNLVCDVHAFNMCACCFNFVDCFNTLMLLVG